jgi:hypothetical protein
MRVVCFRYGDQRNGIADVSPRPSDWKRDGRVCNPPWGINDLAMVNRYDNWEAYGIVPILWLACFQSIHML